MFGAFGPAYCECGPNADWFVQEWFSDCIYTTWEWVAFWIGMSSVLFWIVAQLPQFISNWKNQTAEALSPWFLFQWLAGDSFNLLGCVLTGNQLATQTFTATYFILADCVIISQYIYYNMRETERLALEEEDQGSSSIAHEPIAEFQEPRKETFSDLQKKLPKITILVPDISEDLEVSYEAQHEEHQYHPVSSVTGRSGASMIFNAMHSPRALQSPLVDHTNKTSQYSPSTSITRSPERSRPKGNGQQSNAIHALRAPQSPAVDHTNKTSQYEPSTSITGSPERSTSKGNGHQLNLNAQYHPVTYVTGRSGASMIAHVLHSPKAPHSPHMDHIKRASQTSTLISSACRREIGTSPGVCRKGNLDVQCEASSTSKGIVEPLLERLERLERRTSQFQSVKERNQCLAQNRISAAQHGKIPEIPVEQLFPTVQAMKRRLRRLVNQYGLECGPPSVSRLTIHHVKPLQNHQVDKQMGGTLASKLGSGLKKRPTKAAACLASLLTVKTSTNYFQKSGTSGPTHGVAMGSRRLLVDVRYPGPRISISTVSSTVKTGRKLLVSCGEGDRPWLLKSFGNCLGWGSSALYFGSRFSQIAMNYQRRSAEGLSLAMVICAILANTCMGVSILMRTKSSEDLANKAPWLLGSMGTVALDVFILLQAKYLDARSTKAAQSVSEERTYLLA